MQCQLYKEMQSPNPASLVGQWQHTGKRMRSCLNICIIIQRVLEWKGKNGKYQSGTSSNQVSLCITMKNYQIAIFENKKMLEVRQVRFLKDNCRNVYMYYALRFHNVSVPWPASPFWLAFENLDFWGIAFEQCQQQQANFSSSVFGLTQRQSQK